MLGEVYKRHRAKIAWLCCFLSAAVMLFAWHESRRPQIRIANNSTETMENVRVRFHSGEVDYGTIAAGGATAYRSIEKAYPYAHIETTIGGEPAVLQPVDYVGEKLLRGGHYTYALTINPAAMDKFDRLRLELISNW